MGALDRVWGREQGRADRCWRLVLSDDGFHLSAQAVQQHFSGADADRLRPVRRWFRSTIEVQIGGSRWASEVSVRLRPTSSTWRSPDTWLVIEPPSHWSESRLASPRRHHADELARAPEMDPARERAPAAQDETDSGSAHLVRGTGGLSGSQHRSPTTRRPPSPSCTRTSRP